MKLTKAATARLTLPPGKSEAIFFDDDMPGFGLRLRKGGSASWIAQYRIGTKQARVTLGKLTILDADEARREAKRVLAKAGLGVDHQSERRAREAKAAVTFAAVAEMYLRRSVEKTQRPKTQAERRRHLERDWKPFRGRPVEEINKRDVAARLQAIAEQHGPIASNRARGTLSAFYAWAIAQGLAETNPVIGTAAVGTERARDRVLTMAEVREVWQAAGDDDHATILRLLLLTGQRRNEVAGMSWPELDLDVGMWMIPRERSKNDRPHEVPLSDAAAAILLVLKGKRDELDEDDPLRKRVLLFGTGAGAFSGWSKCKERLDTRIARGRAEHRLGRPLAKGEQPEPADRLVPWTLHDLRRTVVTGMNELGIQPHVVEAVVNHISGRAKAGVAGVYNKATYAAEKRAALARWAEHLMTEIEGRERKVIPLRA
ncbi:MAG TPA: tyrosine-type recombinase/integrase [Geminicoccus sp.]|nr:tyrosine-type recombinase/integrase [Geminicoccus sp.]